MIDRTYIHCPGVGPKSEQTLWQAGYKRWTDVLESPKEVPISHSKLQPFLNIVENSQISLEGKDVEWLASAIPPREHWRAFPQFGQDVCYLDIETDGTSGGDSVTIIGAYDGIELQQFIRGVNLWDFPKYIESKTMIVSFFGTGFDLPVLKNCLGVSFRQFHVDLCFLFKRLGYRGGLKSIEDRLGIERQEIAQGLTGMDAIILWDQHMRGNKTALKRLLAYNEEDVVNMQTLLNWAMPRMTRDTFGIDL